MEEVIAVSFHDRRRAAQAFNLLWQMNDKLVIELDDAVVVHRDRSGNLEYDQDVASTLGRPLIRAGFWGALLGTLVPVSMAVVANVVLDPVVLCGCALVGGMVGIIYGASKVAAEATWWKEHFCASYVLPRRSLTILPRTIQPSSPGLIRRGLKWPLPRSAVSAARSCARPCHRRKWPISKRS